MSDLPELPEPLGWVHPDDIEGDRPGSDYVLVYAHPPVQPTEPVDWQREAELWEEAYHNTLRCADENLKRALKAEDHPPVPVAAEPVAWAVYWGDKSNAKHPSGLSYVSVSDPGVVHANQFKLPLYAHPPALSEWEREKAALHRVMTAMQLTIDRERALSEEFIQEAMRLAHEAYTGEDWRSPDVSKLEAHLRSKG